MRHPAQWSPAGEPRAAGAHPAHTRMVAVLLLGERAQRVPTEAPGHRRVVVHGHPGKATHAGVGFLATAAAERVIERHQKVGDAPEVMPLVGCTPRADPQSIGCVYKREPGILVEPIAIARRGGAQVGVQQRVQEAGMAGVDSAFCRLRPVAFLDSFGRVTVRLRLRGSTRGRAAAGVRCSVPYRPTPRRRARAVGYASALTLLRKSDSAGSFGMSTQVPSAANFQPW